MKNLTLFKALFCLVFLCLVGCSQGSAEDNEHYSYSIGAAGGASLVPNAVTAPPPGNDNNSIADEAEEPVYDGPENAGRIIVQDSPVYRGTVDELQPENGVYKLRLKSAEGTDFGYPSILMQTDENTRANFSLDKLVLGDYLEVYYADRHNGLPSLIVVANLLLPAEDCVYNGEVVSFDQNGALKMTPFGGGNLTVFDFDDFTNFYLDKSGITPGLKLNIFHRGTLTRSLPPHGFAYEVRPYKEY